MFLISSGTWSHELKLEKKLQLILFAENTTLEKETVTLSWSSINNHVISKPKYTVHSTVGHN